MKNIIGVTGGIGSGKTTVCHFYEEMGYPVYYSDTRAKNIVNDSAEIREKIIALLGPGAYEDGVYNRKFVASRIFSDDQLRESLNAIIHPAVAQEYQEWLQHQNAEFVFKETALLFELGLNKACFKTILVTADENIRIKRVMDRTGKTYREVENILNTQMPEKEKIKKADFIIENNGDLATLEDFAIQTLSELKKTVF